MFKTITLTISSLALASITEAQEIPNFNNKTKNNKTGQTIAFVGEKLGLEQIEIHCPEDYICMDLRFNARYRIVELLEGAYEGDTIDFVIYDHYGTPRFAKHQRVILYVQQREGNYYHHKYSYDILHPVKGGGYAYCGDPYNEYEFTEIEVYGRENLTSYKFSPSVKFKVSDHLPNKEDLEWMEQDDIREEFMEAMRRFAPPAFQIKGNTAICKMGMAANEVANIRMEYEFTPQRKHDEHRDKCLDQAGLPEGTVLGKQLEESGYNTCMETHK